VLHAQVLCASNAAHDQVDPIIPPEGVPVGERITFEGFSNEPDAQLNPKKNVFGKLAPDLQTNAGEPAFMPYMYNCHDLLRDSRLLASFSQLLDQILLFEYSQVCRASLLPGRRIRNVWSQATGVCF
jgi:hypothetical protein